MLVFLPIEWKAKSEYLSYNLRRRLVDILLLFVAFELLVSIGDSRGNPPALRGFQLINRTDFLGSLRRISCGYIL